MARSLPPHAQLASGSTARGLRVERPFRLPLEGPGANLAMITRGKRALEAAQFPFEKLSDIAEIESWRK